CLFRNYAHKIAHRCFFLNRKSAAILTSEPKCARRSAVEVQCTLNFEIIGQSRSGKNRRQFGKRNFRGNSEQCAIVRSSCGESPACRARTIQAANALVMIDKKWSTLNRSIHFLAP